MKTRTSVLDHLSEEQHRQLIDWLETHSGREVRDLVAAPPPAGFGLNTHITTLRRFYARYRSQHLAENLDLANAFAQGNSPACLDAGTASALREQAFDLATSPQLSSAAFSAVARWLLRLQQQKQRTEEIEIDKQKLALEEKRLALEQKKFEFNAAREALNHLADLQPIFDDSQKDDEDKIRAARDKVFGVSPQAST